MQLVEEHNIKEQIKAEMGKAETAADLLEGSGDLATGPDVDSRMRTNFTLRNREDVPAYLRPLEKKATGVDADLEDKRQAFSGERLNFLEQEKFAWTLIEKDKQAVVSSVALPTATELLFRRSKKEAEQRQKDMLATIEELYGAQQSENETIGKTAVQTESKPAINETASEEHSEPEKQQSQQKSN